ncbi:hypothetical protein BJX64DRAFT_265928, partial [Aspergillus heterothallicus]
MSSSCHDLHQKLASAFWILFPLWRFSGSDANVSLFCSLCADLRDRMPFIQCATCAIIEKEVYMTVYGVVI